MSDKAMKEAIAVILLGILTRSPFSAFYRHTTPLAAGLGLNLSFPYWEKVTPRSWNEEIELRKKGHYRRTCRLKEGGCLSWVGLCARSSERL